MNALGYDCSTLGNHEFNYGLDFMCKVLAGANFPSSPPTSSTGTLAAEPARRRRSSSSPTSSSTSTLTDGDGDEHPIRIGFIGFVPPQIMIWDAKHLDGKVDDPRHRRDGAGLGARDARRPAPTSSSPSPTPASTPNQTDAHGERLAVPRRASRASTSILTGHQHLVFPGDAFDGLAGVDAAKGTLLGKPGVMAGFWGSHLGIVDLLLERDGDTWRIVSSESEARPIYERKSTARSIAAGRRRGRRRRCRRRPTTRRRSPMSAAPVGKTSAPLHSATSRWSPTIPRCRSSTRRRPGTSRRC